MIEPDRATSLPHGSKFMGLSKNPSGATPFLVSTFLVVLSEVLVGCRIQELREEPARSDQPTASTDDRTIQLTLVSEVFRLPPLLQLDTTSSYGRGEVRVSLLRIDAIGLVGSQYSLDSIAVTDVVELKLESEPPQPLQIYFREDLRGVRASLVPAAGLLSIDTRLPSTVLPVRFWQLALEPILLPRLRDLPIEDGSLPSALVGAGFYGTVSTNSRTGADAIRTVNIESGAGALMHLAQQRTFEYYSLTGHFNIDSPFEVLVEDELRFQEFPTVMSSASERYAVRRRLLIRVSPAK